MRQIILMIAMMLFCSGLYAQNTLENLLAAIVHNNTTLAALRKDVDAGKIANKTGIYPQNPETEFSHLWGTPAAMGIRNDFSIRQTFDFPTAYSYKHQIAGLKNQQAELEYRRQLIAIKLEAALACADLVYTGALQSELRNRFNHATQIALAYHSKFEAGETNVLEYNKAQLNLLNATRELERIDLENSMLLAKLIRLNGGIPIEFNEVRFVEQPIVSDFDQWYALAEKGNPVLQWLIQEISIMQKDVKLQSALTLPRLGVGYMSEKVAGENFQGLTLGFTIPLWEQKNTIRYARAKTVALQSAEADARIQFYQEMQALHARVIGLQKSAAQYRSGLKFFNNTELLKKALDKGEISLIVYMAELSVYYESVDQMLTLERDLNQAVAQLNRFL
jgi:outer membrane protein, heavy metal efflux system